MDYNQFLDLVPISRAMGAKMERVVGEKGYALLSAPQEPNRNLHGSGFAGSIYSLASLAGWAAAYARLSHASAGARMDLVLAEATIQYSKPMLGPVLLFEASVPDLPKESLDRLLSGQRIRVSCVVLGKDSTSAEVNPDSAPALVRFVGEFSAKSTAPGKM